MPIVMQVFTYACVRPVYEVHLCVHTCCIMCVLMMALRQYSRNQCEYAHRCKRRCCSHLYCTVACPTHPTHNWYVLQLQSWRSWWQQRQSAMLSTNKPTNSRAAWLGIPWEHSAQKQAAADTLTRHNAQLQHINHNPCMMQTVSPRCCRSRAVFTH